MSKMGIISQRSSSVLLRAFLQIGVPQTCYTLESPWGSLKKYHGVASTIRHCDLRSFCLKLSDFPLFSIKTCVPFLCTAFLWSCLGMGQHINTAVFWCLFLSLLQKPSASSEVVFLPVCPARFAGLSLEDVDRALSLLAPATMPGTEDNLRVRDSKERMAGTQFFQ